MPAVKTRKELELGAFPAGTVKQYRRYVCLDCIFHIFTKQLKMAPRAAYMAVRGHSPTVEELTGEPVQRPYFDSEEEKFPRCPYCEATKGRLARFEVVRLEASRATTAARKELLEGLPKTESLFEVVEVKASRRDLLFEWLDDLGRRFDFEDRRWLLEAAQAYLEKRDTKTDWAELFTRVRGVRRSIRIEEGCEVTGPWLYLAPGLYDEVLFMQYLVSRSHKSGGLTLEGRLTLPEIMHRLRRRGFFEQHGITGEDPLEVLENLVASLDPGGASAKVVYVIDRRDFLEKTKSVYSKYA